MSSTSMGRILNLKAKSKLLGGPHFEELRIQGARLCHKRSVSSGSASADLGFLDTRKPCNPVLMGLGTSEP